MRITLKAVAFAAALILMDGAAAQETNLLRNAFVGDTPPPREVIERFAVEGGRRSFAINQIDDGALLRFDGAYEVFALTITPGPRGDVIYRLDTGEEFLRLSDLGGVTLFPRERKQGVPATRLLSALSAGPGEALVGISETAEGDSESLGVAVESLRSTFDHFGASVLVAMSEEGEAHPAPMTDAVRITEIGVNQTLRATARKAAEVSTVQFEVGPGPIVTRKDGVLLVVVDPAEGYFGRPSSFAVANTLAE